MDREEMISRFAKFLREYVDDDGNEVYINRLKDLLTVTPKRSLAIDWAHLNSFDPELAEELLNNPEEAIASCEDAIQIILREPPLLVERDLKVHARFYNLPHTILVKELGSEHINRLIQVEGIITRVSEVKPFVQRAIFVCKDCGNEMIRLQRPYENLVKPAKCDACGSRNVELDVEKSRFINFQSFRLQDRPESLKGGQMPRFVDAILLDDLVDTALPGDRVLVTGILRVILEQRDKRPIFKKVLEVNHIEQLSKEIEELEISPEDEQKIRELAKRKDIVDAIVDSIAPAIWGHRVVKKGIALALFGGVQRVLPDGTKLRGESHVLLVGDPGVAKSQLLRYVANLAPRAIYTSGKSSSAAGLTAAAVRDEFTGSWVLEAGVLVLADGGFALIDEFDKMSDRDRSAIHEALEQQSYHHDFELLLADGRKVKIGELVDSLIEANRDKVILGKDTEILPVDDIELLAYDLERKEIVKVKADRVSRHKAPDKFIRLRFSNGREITVTPEHPIMVWEDGEIREKPAENVKPDDLVLAVRRYLSPEENRLDETTAKLLGFLLSEGFSYANPGNGYYEVGFTNTDEKLVEEFKGLLEELGVKYGVQIRERPGEKRLYTVRVISKDFYTKLLSEFPEAFPEKGDERPARRKRVPARVLGADETARRAFLNAFFKGDGFVDKYRVGFTTSSRGMVEDLQDLLLSLGIYSYIFEEKRGETTYYKVIVSGTADMERFAEIVRDDPRIGKIEKLIEVSRRKRNYRDIVPTEVLESLREVLNVLHVNDGGLTNNITARQNANRERVMDYLVKAEERIAELKSSLERGDVEALRAFVTVKELSEKLGTPYSTTLYRLRRGHKETTNALLEIARERLEEAEEKLNDITELVEGNLRFLRVTKVEEIPNDRWEWVYDVTVEPYHLFVSHGLVLHNTISISKAGITATLNARTTVIAAANPKFGRFNRHKSLPEQLDLPPTLLSRFDLIFLLLDEPDEKVDASIAEHILKVRRGEAEVVTPKIPYDLLKKYIAYARKNVHPVLSREAMEEIKRYYVKMRKGLKRGDEEGVQPIPITARQLEALIRLSEAHARMRLSETVTREDARAAIELIEAMMRTIAVDEEGNIDVSILEIGKSSKKLNKIEKLVDIIKNLEGEGDYGAPAEKVIEAAKQAGVGSKREVEKLIEELKADGRIYEPRAGFYRVL
ncbi:LAGLIDADG family homing endonuclease [Thermococcus sp. 21S9]|uniref:LAGLIDADG family homing endonuclease n=1 Tax=Thermococcus sp. 21S9 TaxID=1638223 RepID=UPI001F0D2F26|nr:LAGLIDADG family homing endonuclease [Thermococcus sp. 21S9]